jgi:hypothetical protein
MNTKMNTRIYIGSGHRSVVPYAHCGCMFPLLILERSREELVRRGLKVWGCFGCVLLVARELSCAAWIAFYRQLIGGRYLHLCSP